MARANRTGIKHGGVTGSMRPQSQKTMLMPGRNPRGDGRVSCGHAATQPARYVQRRFKRFEGDVDQYFARRVCQDCFDALSTLADPHSEWVPRNDDEEVVAHETPLELENRVLRIALAIAINRLNNRPDWPTIQALARLALDVEAITNSEHVSADTLMDHLMAEPIQRLLIALDHTNLLPDGRPNRLTTKPSDVTVKGLLNTREAIIDLTPRTVVERDAIWAGTAREPNGEFA